MKPFDQEVWLMKRDIRVAFKIQHCAPAPNEQFYNIGRVIGRGTITKINLVLHKLVRKILVVKSVNKNRITIKKQWK